MTLKSVKWPNWVLGALITVLVSAITLLRAADLRSLDRLDKALQSRADTNASKNAQQDTVLSRINTYLAVEAQRNLDKAKAEERNFTAIMDALSIPEWKRAHLDTSVAHVVISPHQ